jgi:hypothetical protein
LPLMPACDARPAACGNACRMRLAM